MTIDFFQKLCHNYRPSYYLGLAKYDDFAYDFF
jgi:hypothetical protein